MKAHECKERPAGPNIEMCYKTRAYCNRLSVMGTELCDARAEVERLRAALREIADDKTVHLTLSGQVNRHFDYKQIARAALNEGEE